MKKISIIILMSIISVNTLLSLDLADLETQFETLNSDLSSPVTSSATSGLSWSDAHIGNFPHFGVGIFTGVTIIPVDGIDALLDFIEPDAGLPSELSQLGGMTFPVVGADARIGGFILPFDIGVKYAAINKLDILNTVNLDYSIMGADIRYAVVEDNLILPNISIGVGFTRLKTDIIMKDMLGEDIELLAGQLYLDNPDLEYGWESNVVELKAQISKSIIFITPYVGVNAAYGITTIGGGIATKVTGSALSDTALTQGQIDTALTNAGLGDMDVNTSGFTTTTDTTAWSAKVTGGLSFNILLAKIDVSANYDVLSESYGGQLGIRLQL